MNSFPYFSFLPKRNLTLPKKCYERIDVKKLHQILYNRQDEIQLLVLEEWLPALAVYQNHSESVKNNNNENYDKITRI